MWLTHIKDVSLFYTSYRFGVEIRELEKAIVGALSFNKAKVP